MKTVVGVFPNTREAELTADELVQAGFSRSGISLVEKNDIEQQQLISQLVSYGVPQTTARLYVDGLNSGGTLETVRVDDNQVDRALDIMKKHARPLTDKSKLKGGKASKAGKIDEGQTISVLAEELTVGKRDVERGGVKVITRVTEQPVEENVQLRQEHVTVERRPVDRDAALSGDIDDEQFRERTIEMVEHAEEAVVAKRARVIEEIVIRKDVEQRTETIRDTVRKMDVDVQPVAFDADKYRSHYDEDNASSGYRYEDYKPAYKFGHEMRGSSSFSGSSWDEVEPKARTAWEQKNPNTWEKFKASIRHAWDSATK